MGMITGRQITEFVNNKKLGIKPFNRKLIQPASYDLRLHNKILASPLGEDKLGEEVTLEETRPHYKIQPGQMVGVLSYETIKLPLDMCGKFGIRSSFARKGINAFGGIQLDPGFSGRLDMSLLNVGPEPVKITLHEPFFTVEFMRLEEEAEKGYDGPYQNQDDFPKDQKKYILSARTTSLAEIPTLRRSINELNTTFKVFIEEFEERSPDLDDGLELRPEIEEKLIESSRLPRSAFLSPAEIRKKLGL